MNKCQTITIRTQVDVIAARMYVRDMARMLGMNLGDQARISLAASSLAQAMGLGAMRQGQVTMEIVHNNERKGVRVVCVENDNTAQSAETVTLGDTRWMVDEYTIEKLPTNQLQVTLIKWMA